MSEVGAPPNGKSWIRNCYLYSIYDLLTMYLVPLEIHDILLIAVTSG